MLSTTNLDIQLGGIVEFSLLKDHLLDFIFQEFDHNLIADKNNDPFIQMSVINISAINPHRDSFGMYLIRPGKSATHENFTTYIMAESLKLEGEYLLQKPSAVLPIETTLGCVRGLTVGKNQFLIITVITNLDDARFVCRSIINKLQIVLG